MKAKNKNKKLTLEPQNRTEAAKVNEEALGIHTDIEGIVPRFIPPS